MPGEIKPALFLSYFRSGFKPKKMKRSLAVHTNLLIFLFILQNLFLFIPQDVPQGPAIQPPAIGQNSIHPLSNFLKHNTEKVISTDNLIAEEEDLIKENTLAKYKISFTLISFSSTIPYNNCPILKTSSFISSIRFLVKRIILNSVLRI